MFLVNSCLGQFSAAYSRRHPFSRSYGVNLPSSLTTLLPMALGSSPHLPVSVCGTGSTTNPITFSRHKLHSLRLIRLAYARGNQRPVELYSCVSDLNSCAGYGISTVCASTTPFGLALAPGLPWADEPSPGNLRLSMAWILTMLSLLIPAFSLLSRPHILSIMLRPTIECSSTTCTYVQIRNFGV